MSRASVPRVLAEHFPVALNRVDRRAQVMAQRPAILRQVSATIGPVDGRGIEQVEYEVMEIPAGIEDALKIVGDLPAARLHRVVHQHFRIAHDRDCGRAQFLPYVGNECPFGSPVGALVNLIVRDTTPVPTRRPRRCPLRRPWSQARPQSCQADAPFRLAWCRSRRSLLPSPSRDHRPSRAPSTRSPGFSG